MHDMYTQSTILFKKKERESQTKLPTTSGGQQQQRSLSMDARLTSIEPRVVSFEHKSTVMDTVILIDQCLRMMR